MIPFSTTITLGSRPVVLSAEFLLLLALSLFPMHAASVSSSDGPPRIPWTTSRMVGSPEAPLPYVSARVYPNLVFDNPTELDFLPDGSYGFVIERSARLLTFTNHPGVKETTVVADLNQGRDGRTEAYAMVFDPDFTTNHHVFISLTKRVNRAASMKVSRFTMTALNPPRIDLATELPIIEWPSGGHNGCDLHFGLDGYLYASTGDGDSPAPPDPRHTGQNLDDLLSTIIRIDVRQATAKEPYRIPPDNPFLKQAGARPEIWAYGFRNPWKTCIDPRDGALWIGDVGWENWELVFRVDHGGFNGGWSAVEGPQNVNVTWPKGPTPITPPLKFHAHTEATSITGGRIYQGQRFPELRDAFVYGDWGTGRLWALRFAEGTIQAQWELALTSQRVVGFAEDQNRELFYIDNAGGGIYELRPHKVQPSTHEFPTRLSETGLWADTATYQLAPGVYPYSITAPMWSDHAEIERALALPGQSSLVQAGDLFESPTNAVFVRTMSLEMKRGQPASLRRIETQILHFDGLNFNGYAYRWKDDQTDALLVEKEGLEVPLQISDPTAPLGVRDQTWRFLSRSECGRCHISRYNSRFGNLTGLVPDQLTFAHRSADQSELDRLARLRLITHPRPVKASAKLVDPRDASASLEERARSWLHANCAHCHRRDGGGAVFMYLQYHLSPDQMAVFDEPALRGTFGLDQARRIAPGQPFHSTVLYRILTTSSGRMPIIGSSMVDEEGARLVCDWITSLNSDRAALAKPASDWSDWPDAQMTQVAPLWATNTSGAMKLAMVAADSRRSAFVRQQIIQTATTSGYAPARDLLERFLPMAQRRQVLGASPIPGLILARAGNAGSGRELFFSPTGPQCFTCHHLFGNGQDFGPNLEHIASKYDRAALLEQIIHPNQILDPIWSPYTVETKDDESITGFVLSKTDQEMRVKIAADTVTSIPMNEVKAVRKMETSLMPEGLLQATTAQEAADLLEFLGTLQ